MTTTLSPSSGYALNSGSKIPVIGLGVFKASEAEASLAVQEVFKSGYRHVDTAVYYENQSAVAKAVLKAGVPRDQLFFTTKVHPTATSYEGAKEQVAKTLQEIGGLKYVDLMLIHAPYGGAEKRLGAWKALTEAVQEGKIRSIGVSNYGVDHLTDLEQYIKDTDAKLGKGKGGVLSVNQIELHPWLQRRDIIDWCKKRGVLVQAWAPLAQSSRWGDPLLKNIAKRTGKSEAQILLRWSLQKDFNPLPKSVTPARIQQNLDVFDFELTDKEMAELETDEYDVHGWE
ncbi:hypothetical protein M409DRAFT_62232 [Zasmidium cellare ATCC 36951]|uniref:NADP-dependent oxidoreductase domain-containing protein n=1 Tax=Zasmidium cellare ATCC 36951 TaxID=1080233 RepID=A0A6A6D3T0_ZASCE|nr:uncharacterized protein M409DRAFT_62232 [Zasmidium cellare ATCC 36951]KAF2174071.1 hypothetical protein M409DRAFT_62232 [Zasmidium cellare ATCC 36951]